MAYYLRTSPDFNPTRSVKITTTETVDKYTVYDIELCLGAYHWIVKHRYNEFRDLHDRLVSRYKIEKGLLPPKKLFGNSSEAFIRKRQGELELYLQTLLYKLSPLPSELAAFLHFDRYEIHGITHVLAEELFHQGDLILQSGEPFSLTPLQLYAITKRLKLPEPTCDTGDAKKDIGHILDFITSVKHIKIIGQHCQLGTSNILMNDLSYEVNMFKSLEVLELALCNPTKITATEGLKKTVKRLKVFNTISKLKIRFIAVVQQNDHSTQGMEILLVDVEFGQWLGLEDEAVLVPTWTNLVFADFSYNHLDTIDESVKLMPRVQELDLSHNMLSDLCHLQHLSCLTHLDISNNQMHLLEALHTKLGNITTLCLANNKLESLEGFSKLYSLEKLDISNNEVSQVLEVQHISNLPCLESLDLTNNPVTIVLDYRTKVFELFKDRAKELALDGEKATQKELDTVAVLLALQKSKHTREKSKRHRRVREVTIADPSSDSSRSLSPTQEEHSRNKVYNQGHSYSDVKAASRSDSHCSSSQDVADGSSLSDTGKGCVLSSSHRVNTSDQRSGRLSPSASHKITSTVNESGCEIIGNTEERRLIDVSMSSRPHCPDLTTEVDVQPTLGYQHCIEWTNSESHLTRGGSLLPETLPNRSNAAFVSHVQELLPSPSSLSHSSHRSDDSHEKQEERVIHVMWSAVLCYTEPSREVMACICLSTENLHLLRVSSLRGDDGMPSLVHMHCIPLVNLEQIVLGYQRQYLRIEEALVGPQGTYVLLTGSMTKTDLFLDSLKLAYRRAISDIDQYEDPHITANCQAETNLLRALSRFEQGVKPEDITVSLYMLVNAVDYSQADHPFITHSLVMTNNYLYLLKEDFVMWPQATFAVGPTTRSQFVVICAFPIMGKITGIQMYDSDTYSPDKDTSLSQTFSATNTCAMVVPNFIGFGVKLTFDMGSLGQQSVDIRVSTSGMRDRFLATLTQLRKEHSERMSSPAKPSRSRVRLKDADTDSLSTNSGSSNHGTRFAHHRHSVGSKHKHRSKGHHEGKKQERTSGQRPDLLPDLNTMSSALSVDESGRCSNEVRSRCDGDGRAEDFDSSPDVESSDDMTCQGILVRDSAGGRCANSEDLSSSEDSVRGVERLSQNKRVKGPEENYLVSHSNSDSNSASTKSVPKYSLEDRCQVGSVHGSLEFVDSTANNSVLQIVHCTPVSGGVLESVAEQRTECLNRSSSVDHNDALWDSSDNSPDADHRQEVIKAQSEGDPGNNGRDLEASSSSNKVTSPPAILKSQLTLDVQYPSMALLSHLTECNQQIRLLQALPDVLKNILAMEGDELLNFFHGSVARIGQETEELRHVLWSPVLPYTKPQKEVVTFVMVSTKAVYLLSDRNPQDHIVRLKEWKSHSRNRSDSYRLLRERHGGELADIHLSSGVVHQCRNAGKATAKTARTYAVLPLKELKQVTIGLFDQSFRLVGPTAETTFTCMTRDNRLTGDFIRNLMSVLSAVEPTPSPECCPGGGPLDAESDFYGMFNTYSRLESEEYKHQSKVKFVYPSEDLVTELLYVISNSDGNQCQQVLHLLMYLTVFLKDNPPADRQCSDAADAAVDDDDDKGEAAEGATYRQLGRPVSLVLSEQFLTLCIEDHVHYPIPEFAFGPPAVPRLRILDNRPLKHLKRIVLHLSDDHLMTAVFSDEKEIVVNPEFDHYTPYGGRVRRHVARTPEVSIVALVQNLAYKEKLVGLLRKQWAEIQQCETELEVVYTDS